MDKQNVAYETYTLDWRSIRIEVRYCVSYFDIMDHLAHIEIESVVPSRARLPITETGDKSYFTSSAQIEDYCGPVAYVKRALDQDAEDPTWLAWEAQQKQLTLF